jgi:hypothetical protein
VVVNPLNQGEGTVVLLGVGRVLVDGRSVLVSGSTPLTLSAGPHTLRTSIGKKALAIAVGGGEIAHIEIGEMILARK